MALLAPTALLGASRDAPSAAAVAAFQELSAVLRTWQERLPSAEAAERERLAQDLAGFVEHLEQVRDQLSRGDIAGRETWLRKQAALAAEARACQEALAGTGPADCRVAVRASPVPRTPTPLRAGPRCELAPPVGSGTWGLLLATRVPRPGEEAWLRFTAPRAGTFAAHTVGSTGDPEVAVFADCRGGAIASDDDSLGLQAVAGFPAAAGDVRWIRVRLLADQPAGNLLITLGGTGAITGMVTAATTNQPLGGVRVDFYSSLGYYAGTTYTAANGVYLGSGFSAGTYFVLTRYTDEYLDELWDDRPCEESCSVLTGDPVTVLDGQTTSGIDFALTAGGRIAGRVRDSQTGQLLQSILVRVYSSAGSFVAYEYTDAFGEYDAGGLAPGTFFVRTDTSSAYRDEVYDDFPCSSPCNPLDGTPIEVAAEQTVGGIDFDLDPLGSISGDATDAVTQLPIPYAYVRLYNAGGYWVGSATADAGGHYTLGGIEPGGYFVSTDLYSTYRDEVYDDVPCSANGCQPTNGTLVYVELGEEVVGIDFALDRLGILEGRVTDAGSGVGIPFWQVEAYNDAGVQVAYTSSNVAGDYAIGSLYPGTYFAATDDAPLYVDELFDDLQCPGGPPGGCNPLDGQPIPVDLNATTLGVDFALDAGGAITGSLREETTGAPIASASVRLWRSNGSLLATDTTDSQGFYRFDGLTQGNHFVSTATGPAYFDELYDDIDCSQGCNPTTGTPIPVELGQTTEGIDFDLALRGGLGGQVVDEATGQPVAGVVLDVWNQNGQLVAANVTNATGFYIVDLSSGTYFVSTDAGEEWIDEIFDDVPCPEGPASEGACDPLTGSHVVVIGAEPAVTGVSFALRNRTVFADGFESGDTSAWTTTVN